LKAYAAEGVHIWGVTIQNEPQASQPFESCIWSARQERDFLKNNLGPQLLRDGLGDVKVLVHDHNKGHLSRAYTILDDPAAARYAYGTAFHWYQGDHFSRVSALHDKFPGKFLFGTEVAEPGPKYDWGQAERETHDLIGDLNNWANGWTEWNMVLDERGGPGWTGSVGAAPVHINSTNGSISYNPHYYYIAHFSKYIRPDAVRIDVVNHTSDLEATAFKNADDRVVVVVMNRNASVVAFRIQQNNWIIKPTIPAHAIVNFMYSEN
jgi:glucosylceramidase